MCPTQCHRGHMREDLSNDGSGFKCWWGGQWTHFIKFCQRAQWNVCKALFLCMSLLMEFLVADVATRSLLMSFVKDNYGLLSVAEELDEKLALCALCEDSIFIPLHSEWPEWPASPGWGPLSCNDGVQSNVQDITQVSTNETNLSLVVYYFCLYLNWIDLAWDKTQYSNMETECSVLL